MIILLKTSMWSNHMNLKLTKDKYLLNIDKKSG
jgi:hypothetical protein